MGGGLARLVHRLAAAILPQGEGHIRAGSRATTCSVERLLKARRILQQLMQGRGALDNKVGARHAIFAYGEPYLHFAKFGRVQPDREGARAAGCFGGDGER